MILKQTYDISKNKNPLELVEIGKPKPAKEEILIKITACGVCHTELDEIEGRTPPAYFPMVLGHQVVGFVEQTSNQTRYKEGDRVGVAWIYSACGICNFCINGNENLCQQFKATGRDAYGGYAQYMKIPEDFVYQIPDNFSDYEAAPLLCAGAIGYRSINLTGLQDGQNLGLTGFGASAHLVLKMVRHKYSNCNIFVFARSKNEQIFAKELGAVWAGATEDKSPEKLDCIIDTTPVWKPVVEALGNLSGNGRLVINAIRKENVDKEYLQHLNYSDHIWLEKEIKSVANVTRNDVNEFLKLAAQIPIKPEYQLYKLEEANIALRELKERKIRGAKVLQID